MNGLLEPSGPDRITETDRHFAQRDGDMWEDTTQYVYPYTNDPTAIETGTQSRRLTGMNNGLIAETRLLDIHGNATIRRTWLDRSTRSETRVIDYPDSAVDEVLTTVDGLPASLQDKTGRVVTYTHDALGRKTGTTDPRTGASTLEYDSNHRVIAGTDPAGNSTTYA